MSSNQRIIRVITRASDGSIREKDYESFDDIAILHDQVGIDDCSTDLELRGMPIFRGLVGPLPDGKEVVRYESPDIFEALTKEWTNQKAKRRRRRKSSEVKLCQLHTLNPSEDSSSSSALYLYQSGTCRSVSQADKSKPGNAPLTGRFFMR